MGYRTSSIEIIVGTLTITDAALAAFEQEHEIGMVGNGLRLGAPMENGDRSIGPHLPSGECALSHEDVLVALLKSTRGRADVLVTWEGGDSFSGYRVDDGQVFACDVERRLTPKMGGPL